MLNDAIRTGGVAGGGKAAPPLPVSATETPCPTPNPFTYTDKGRPDSYTAFCEGTAEYNGFYGYGIVDALAAVGRDVLDDE